MRHIHQHLHEKYTDWPLSGSYLQAHDIGQFEGAIEAYPYYDEGVLRESGYFDINSVTWWLLKHRGLTLFGTNPQHLDFDVDWDKLIADMRENLNTYWVQFTRLNKRLGWLLTDDGIQWTVLGALRQFYTFREHNITSKIGAGEYGLQHLPQRWHTIIQEALNIRNQVGIPQYRFRILRAIEAYRFMKYIIYFCNTIFD